MPFYVSHLEEIVDALLGHYFITLKRLDILIVPRTRPDEAEEIVVALQESGYIERLRSRQPEGMEVNVLDMTGLPGKPFANPEYIGS